MALIDVAKLDAWQDRLANKFPIADLKLWTQLIVRPGQVAIFVKGGKLEAVYQQGTYTLKSYNLPILNHLINLPLGGESPFSAEVWFINTLFILDNIWGTPTSLMLEDPFYKIVVPLRAYGQYGIRILAPELFYNRIIGSLQLFTAEQLHSYFTGMICSQAAEILASEMVEKQIQLLHLPARLPDLSQVLAERLKPLFSEFGVELVNFYLISINFPESDSAIQALKAVSQKRMQLSVLGKEIYAFDRTLDFLDKAAVNPGDSGSVMNAALGLGVGLGVLPALGGKLSDQLHFGLKPEANYYYLDASQPKGPYALEAFLALIRAGGITSNTFVWKPGFDAWQPASALPELSPGFAKPLFPPPPEKA